MTNPTQTQAPERIEYFVRAGVKQIESNGVVYERYAEVYRTNPTELFARVYGNSFDECRTKANQLAAAMQPAPSESDEAVAREIADYAVIGGQLNMNCLVAEQIIARHRQPASKDAAELWDKLQCSNADDGRSILQSLIARAQPEAVTSAGDVEKIHEACMIVSHKANGLTSFDAAKIIDALEQAKRSATAEADLAKAREVIAELVGMLEHGQTVISAHLRIMEKEGKHSQTLKMLRDDMLKHAALQSASAFREGK